MRTQFLFTLITTCLIMTGSSATAQELLGYWALEETSVGDAAVDSSGNGFDGEYQDDVDPDVEGAPGFGSGAYFDGETGQILIGPGDENGFGDLTDDFSVMAWIKPEQLDRKNRVFGGFPVGGGWGWGTAGDNLEITTYGVKDYDQPVPIELDEWTHAAIVLDDNFEAHFYVNGEFIGTQTHPGPGNPTINDYYIGYSCCSTPQEHFQGSLDEVAVFSGALTDEQVMNAFTLGVSNFNGGGGDECDFDADGSLGLGDLDLLLNEVKAGTNDLKFDVTSDGAVNVDDIKSFVSDAGKLNTWVGDTNLDGEFNSTDLVGLFQAGEFEDGVAMNSTWATGDFDGDGDFGTGDLVAAFQGGGFEQGPRAAVASVPEPNAIVLTLCGMIGLLRFRRRN